MDPRPPYQDRREAGRELARHLRHLAGPSTVVLGLPRGGIPVAYEVARALGAPLDVFVVRKLGHPGAPEYAMGAIASGGVIVMDPLPFGVTQADVDTVIAAEQVELGRREKLYRPGLPAMELAGRTFIVVDDGLATGSTMRAAVTALRQSRPAKLVCAVPVGAEDTVERLRAVADEVVCPWTPSPFQAVGLWYSDFAQTQDEEVRALLAR
jgi:predicted phosphoribosyltransferase